MRFKAVKKIFRPQGRAEVTFGYYGLLFLNLFYDLYYVEYSVYGTVSRREAATGCMAKNGTKFPSVLKVTSTQCCRNLR